MLFWCSLILCFKTTFKNLGWQFRDWTNEFLKRSLQPSKLYPIFFPKLDNLYIPEINSHSYKFFRPVCLSLSVGWSLTFKALKDNLNLYLHLVSFFPNITSCYQRLCLLSCSFQRNHLLMSWYPLRNFTFFSNLFPRLPITWTTN